MTYPTPQTRPSHTSRDRQGAVPSQPAHLHPADAQAYLITFTTYGSWLHGTTRGSVDKTHNIPGTPVLSADEPREKNARAALKNPPFFIREHHRAAICAAITQVADYRGWHLLALSVRTNHVHAVVVADTNPERIMIDFKAYATRHMKSAGLIQDGACVWTRHGSTRYLNAQSVPAAIQYVSDSQGPGLPGQISLPPSRPLETRMGNHRSLTFAARYRRAAGFTIVEVVVAMGVVMILLYIISLLFSQVSKASDLILVNYAVSSYNTALGAQLRDDIRRINKDGFMVVRNHALQDPTTGTWTNIDQILFFTSGEVSSQMYGLQWVQPDGTVAGVPATGESDSGLRRTFTSSDARVWYGHVNPAATMAYGANDPLGSFATVDSRLWALGRQQLLLAGKFVGLDSTSTLMAPADDIWFNKPSPTLGVATTNFFGGATRSITPFVDGRTDIVADPVTATPDAIRSAILNGDIDPTTAGSQTPRILNTAAPWSQPWFGGPPTWAGIDQYERMEGACFRPYGVRKLPISNALSVDFLQTQIIIAPYCSNFKIEFAGDYTNPTDGAYVPASPLTSTLTTDRDGVIDVVKTVGGGLGGPNGATSYTSVAPPYEPTPYSIYWYGGYDTATGFRNVVLPVAGASNYGNGSGTRALNTRLANMTTVAASGNINNNLYTAVFGYDKSTTPWPRLLRITANLQDDKGRLREAYMGNKNAAGAVDGKQFQFIIEVPQ